MNTATQTLQTVPLSTYGGLVTIADPTSLPEGASPRTNDTDFFVGSVSTRGGCVPKYTYNGAEAGPSPGTVATSTSLGYSPWSNPGNALLNTGVYATNTLTVNGAQTLTIASVQVCTWQFPGGKPRNYAAIVTFNQKVPAFVTGQTYTFSGLTNYTYLNGLVLTPLTPWPGGTGGPNLTSYQQVFQVSNTEYPYSESDTGQAIVNAGSVDYSDALDIKTLGFSLPSTDTPTGFVVTVDAYSSSAANIAAQMLKGGVPYGNIESVALPVGSVGTVVLGASNDLFGGSWTYADLNNTGFGVRITANDGAGDQVYVGYTTITAYYNSSQTNFTFIGSFIPENGDLQNNSVDANGNIWTEYVTTNPGVLYPLRSNIANGSHGYGITADNAYLMAFSDLTQGIDIPLQYRNGWIDRISQVGPGAPPQFTGNTNVGTVATITAYSSSTNVYILTAANTFTPGEVVSLMVTAGPTALNGLTLNVLGTGLSTTQFEVSYTGASGSGSATGTAAPQYSYPISASSGGITQYASQPTAQSGFDDILWSSGPGSTSSGNLITIYYDENEQDTTLVTAVEDGTYPVYVYVSGTNQAMANGTFQVTSVGIGKPPGGAGNRFYFTFNVTTTGYQNLGGGANAQPGRYQMTVATLTTTVPIPNLTVGNQIVNSGVGVSNWNATWSIVATPNSGTYTILNTQMSSAGVATYQWAYSSGVAPVPGELVTVTGTYNGSGIFNVTDAVVGTVTGTSAGTFTIIGFPGVYISPSGEEGLAETAGTQFMIDPGPSVAGTSTNPIYGNSGGGYLTVVGGTVQVIGTGTRQGVVFFITRNGYWTAPSPPITFTTSVNANYVYANNIPIGPLNTIGRGIAFTEAGQLGVPGANFFTLPQPVSFQVFNTTYTSSSLIIWDNVTTAAQFTFTDSVLLDGESIDVEGNNLFNLIELGNPAWMAEYDSRIFYGLCQNKIQNFLNMSFDGGYLPNPSGNISPLGWSLDTASNPAGLTATVQVSPTFGNSYYIMNNTGSTQAVLGMIYQSAYQDAYQQPILNAGGLPTLYSVRVTARIPSGLTTGSLVLDLVSNTSTGYGASFGSFTLPFASMTSNMVTYSGTILTATLPTIPSGLVIRYYASGIGANCDLEVDHIEAFPTLIPVEKTVVYASYINNPEAIDGVTGRIVSSNQNNQAVMGATKRYQALYLQKESSEYSLQSVAGQEPSNWGEPSSSAQVGACGIYAYDGNSDQQTGEQWTVSACRKGVYLQEGGTPKKMTGEIFQVWDAINWAAGNSIWVSNDITARKLYVGVPLPTPNFWLPNAPVNAAPTSPNVILMCNYQGVDSGEALGSSPGLHTTMFGKLAALDMRRKWSIWQIPSPYAGLIGENRLDSQLNICNGLSNSKVYYLNNTLSGFDDGNAFTSLYTTFGFVDDAKAAELPMLGYFRKRWKMMHGIIEGSGQMAPTFYPNVLLGPNDSTANFYPWTMPWPWTLTSPPVQDVSTNLNFPCYRMFVEMAVTGGWFRASALRVSGTADVWNKIGTLGPTS